MSIIDLEIKNGTSLLPVPTASSVSDRSSCGANVYLFLFVALLIVAILLVAEFICYCRKNNSEKVSNKIYDVSYSNTGTLNF